MAATGGQSDRLRCGYTQGVPRPAVTDEQMRHLQDVPDGAGCTEIWERLSAHRVAATSVEYPTEMDGDEPDDECDTQVYDHRDETDEDDDPSGIHGT